MLTKRNPVSLVPRFETEASISEGLGLGLTKWSHDVTLASFEASRVLSDGLSLFSDGEHIWQRHCGMRLRFSTGVGSDHHVSRIDSKSREFSFCFMLLCLFRAQQYHQSSYNEELDDQLCLNSILHFVTRARWQSLMLEDLHALLLALDCKLRGAAASLSMTGT